LGGDGRDMWRRGEDGVECVMQYRKGEGRTDGAMIVARNDGLTFFLFSCRR